MNTTGQDSRITVLEPPLPEALSGEVLGFWQEIFRTDYGLFRGVLAAEESGQNRDVFYLIRAGDELAGTCHLTVSRSNPELGGLGEVATAPEFRGAGIGGRLSERARDDFRSAGGRALFLGTINPTAARLYGRLGWRKLPGANVMVCLAAGESFDAFVADYFNDPSPATIEPGSAAGRIPMIPLIVTPHDWQLMDANTDLVSTRYRDQNSCMGLYPRYERLIHDGRGAWFSAQTAQGRTVGLSTVRLADDGRCEVDGFTHGNHAGAWDNLLQASMVWAVAHGARRCWARVSVEDEDKIARFEALGFHPTGAGLLLDLRDRQVNCSCLERAG